MAHGLEAIDWAAPWLQPWRAVGEAVAGRTQGVWAAVRSAPCPPPALRAPPLPAQNAPPPSLLAEPSIAQALNAAPVLAGCPPAPVRFVPQSELPPGVAYEQFIFDTQQVPTRDGLHDFFNGLCWLHFPATKTRLNQLQAAQIAQAGIQPVRGPARDALTVFDENAAFFVGPDAVWDALVRKDWQQLFVTGRAAWQDVQLVLFGHALLEKLVYPRKPVTAHVYRAQAAMNSIAILAELDRVVAADLNAQRLATKPFAHLPVLGVPGWCAQNESPAFYADVSVFRPPRGSAAHSGDNGGQASCADHATTP